MVIWPISNFSVVWPIETLSLYFHLLIIRNRSISFCILQTTSYCTIRSMHYSPVVISWLSYIKGLWLYRTAYGNHSIMSLWHSDDYANLSMFNYIESTFLMLMLTICRLTIHTFTSIYMIFILSLWFKNIFLCFKSRLRSKETKN